MTDYSKGKEYLVILQDTGYYGNVPHYLPSRIFTGTLVNTTGSHFYFESEKNGLTIVPHCAIDYMMKTKERKDKNETLA